MRVERPGCGDSEGGPLRDTDFETELNGYKEALRALKKLDFVDADNVFLFGHSMGGIMAPLVALDVPVRGIAAYGMLGRTWIEGILGQRRRLNSLDGTDPAEVDREMLRQARFWYPLSVEKKTPREILERDPELKKLGWVTDDTYVGDRHYKFHHQIVERNLAEAWTKVAATRLSVGGKVPENPPQPRVLVLWGTSDWLVDREGNAWIAEVVNRVKPGNGKFVALDAIDHFFFRTASVEESYKLWKPAKGAAPGKFNPVLLETLRAWLDETTGKPKKGPEKPPITHRKNIEVDDGILRCVTLSPDGNMVACCGDQFVRVFDVKSGKRLKQLDGHDGTATAVAFSPDGKWLATAGEDQTVRLWEVENWKSKAVMKKSVQRDPAPGTCLSFSHDSKTLASCSTAKPLTSDVWLWSVERTRWELILSTPHREGCWHVAFSPDGKYIATAGVPNPNQKAGQVCLHEEADGPRFLSTHRHDGEQPATCVCFSPDGKTLASTGFDNTIRLRDVKTGEERFKLTGPKGSRGMQVAAYLPGGERLVSVTFEETIQLWDATKGNLLATSNGTDKGVRSAALSSDGKTLATCARTRPSSSGI